VHRRASILGAGNGIRTRDIQLGRLTLYHLSYSRLGSLFHGGGWIRTNEGESRQIYSLLPLATWVPLRTLSFVLSAFLGFGSPVPLSIPPVAGAGIRTPDLLITNQLLYQLSYTGKRRTYSKLGWTTTPARGPEQRLY
jgi:hypothetical protein